MFSGLSTYLFGPNENSNEFGDSVLRERSITGSDGDDWVIVEINKGSRSGKENKQQAKNFAGETSRIGGNDDENDGDDDDDDDDECYLTVSKLVQLTGQNEEGKNGVDSDSDGASDEEGDDEEDEEDGNETLNSEEENQFSDGLPATLNISSSSHDAAVNSNPVKISRSISSSTYSNNADKKKQAMGRNERRQEDYGLGNSNNNSNANNETAIKRKKKKSSNHIGTMEGSWFITPPPCFISHNKSINKVSASPLEDILIEHPSISVFHSHTSSSDSFFPLLSSGSMSTTNNNVSSDSLLHPNNMTMPAASGIRTGLSYAAAVAGSPSVSPSSKPSTSSASSPSLASIVAGSSSNSSSPAATISSSPRSHLLMIPFIQARSNRATDPANRLNTTNNNNQQQQPEETQHTQRVQRGDTRGARSSLGAHERAGHLSEITNVLAPMQKAMNQGSQKYLKKSFMDRQNLVNYQSNRRPTRRQRASQRPSGYSNNRKMC